MYERNLCVTRYTHPKAVTEYMILILSERKRMGGGLAKPTHKYSQSMAENREMGHV